MSRIKVDAIETTGGVQVYPNRAWAVLDGTGVVSVTGSGNVSSLTDEGVGTYTLNYADAFSSANYALVGTAPNFPDGTKRAVNILGADNDGTATVKTTSATRMITGQTNTLTFFDTRNLCVIVSL